MRTDPSSSPAARANVLGEIARDLTYAGRLLRRSPGVVTVTVLGLGLAIGVSTAVFSLLNVVAFRPTGHRRSVVGGPSDAGLSKRDRERVAYSVYLALRDGARSVRLEASLRGAASVSRRPGSDVPDTASLLFVSGGYLSALSNRTSLGRVLSAADDAPGAPPVAVVSHGWWSRQLARRPLDRRPTGLAERDAVHGRRRERARVQRARPTRRRRSG